MTIDKMEVRVRIARGVCSTCTQGGRPSDESRSILRTEGDIMT